MKKTDTWMPLYIGDYLADTSHLTTEQHGAYLLLLMALWKRGGDGLPDVDANLAAAARMPTTRWKVARMALIDGVLLRTDGKAVTQKRLDEELTRAGQITKARANAGAKGGAKGGANRAANSQQNSTPSQSQSQSQEKPPSGVTRGRATHPEKPEGVGETVWTDWLALRRAKKAPVTETVLADARRESAKAGMPLEAFLAEWCSRGSQGLKAEWLANGSHQAKPINRQLAIEAENRRVLAEALGKGEDR